MRKFVIAIALALVIQTGASADYVPGEMTQCVKDSDCAAQETAACCGIPWFIPYSKSSSKQFAEWFEEQMKKLINLDCPCSLSRYPGGPSDPELKACKEKLVASSKCRSGHCKITVSPPPDCKEDV